MSGYFFCLLEILEGRTVLHISLIEVVDHKSTRHLMPLLSKEVGRYRGVNSTGESYEDAFFFMRHDL